MRIKDPTCRGSGVAGVVIKGIKEFALIWLLIAIGHTNTSPGINSGHEGYHQKNKGGCLGKGSLCSCIRWDLHLANLGGQYVSNAIATTMANKPRIT
jgi:hypothetical protein